MFFVSMSGSFDVFTRALLVHALHVNATGSDGLKYLGFSQILYAKRCNREYVSATVFIEIFKSSYKFFYNSEPGSRKTPTSKYV